MLFVHARNVGSHQNVTKKKNHLFYLERVICGKIPNKYLSEASSNYLLLHMESDVLYVFNNVDSALKFSFQKNILWNKTQESDTLNKLFNYVNVYLVNIEHGLMPTL